MKILILGSGILYFIMNVAGCRKNDPDTIPHPVRFVDASFSIGEVIPDRYSCKDPAQKFPHFRWEASTSITSSYVLIMDDPDAVPVAGKVWNHWLLYNIPAGTTEIAEGQDKYGPLPKGTFSGTSSFGDTAYGGPCPPVGQKHTYVFTLYGLNVANLGLPRGANVAEVRTAMKAHLVDSAVYTGTFMR
jgi:Raf kinase inhibitor-like YbhB/YbcL family protein